VRSTLRVATATTAAALVATTGALLTGVLGVPAVSSSSMAPTVCSGQRVLVWGLGASERAAHDDLVTFQDPRDGDDTLKRVVAVGGQTVEVWDGTLKVDGRAVVEPYLDMESVDGMFFGPVRVPDEAVFVLGDSRERSIDSRDFGAVPRELISGVVFARFGTGC